jgi:2-desacetyl-2-hydroxyethyl bacteriochlorophyllide A dehydrogenase
MKRRSLFFTGPGETVVREEPVEEAAPGQVLVKTKLSAISAGTESLIYGGKVPPDMPLDTAIRGLSGPLRYPLKYGYAAVGKVIAAGTAVSREWIARRVFSLHPHESCFTAPVEDLVPLPDGIRDEDAVFLGFMETAVNLVMDGKPQMGEQVVLFGQGVIGLLTTALLARFPLGNLVTVDPCELRRKKSQELGAHASFDPRVPEITRTMRALLATDSAYGGADLSYEVSGNPQALNDAVTISGFDGRIVTGSWYGQKRGELYLGGAFHRDRVRIISSQVSTIAPEYSGRWTKQRRIQTALRMISVLKPSALVSHRIPIGKAPEAYAMIENGKDSVLQVLLTYD